MKTPVTGAPGRHMVSRIALCVLPVVLCLGCTPDGATRDGQPTDEEPAE